MRELPGGRFDMGDKSGRADERPLHSVRLDAFSMAAYPVSNAEYAVFLERTGHDGPVEWMQPRFDRPDLPVCGVSWLDAVAYADWLSAFSGRRFHLPTEAQREYAARGGRAGRAYPWGDDPLPLSGPYARGLSGPITGGPMPIAGPDSIGPNDFGLHHMADNVHEWCADYYDARYYRSSPERNPGGPEKGDRRAARGGAWRHDIKFCRCGARSSLKPDKRFADFGFRLAESPSFEYTFAQGNVLR
jgi:formylglycine-generating enzyme required for sulfatase activity